MYVWVGTVRPCILLYATLEQMLFNQMESQLADEILKA
jgi:hypothetical protein